VTNIIGTAINNSALIIPAGGAGKSQLTGEPALPLRGDKLTATFAMLFQNAENSLAGEVSESEAAVLSESNDEEQPNFDLLGFAAANGMFVGNQANTAPTAKADNQASTVSTVDSEAGTVMRTMIPTYGVQAETQNSESMQVNTGASESGFGSVMNQKAVSETTTSHSGTRVLDEVNGLQQNSTGAKAQGTAGQNASTSQRSFEMVGTEADSVLNVRFGQNNADTFQRDLKAIRAELDVRTGFRHSNVVNHNVDVVNTGTSAVSENHTGKNIGSEDSSELNFRSTGKEHGRAFMLRDESNGQFSVSQPVAGKAIDNGHEPGANFFSRNAGTDLDGNETDFEFPFKDKSSVATEKVDAFNAATVQSSSQVQSSAVSGIEAKTEEAQTMNSIVAQLETPIKREASKGENTSFRIKLKPEGLGEVTVDLKHDAGKLEVLIKTELSSTRELISEGINTLKNALTSDNAQKAVLTSLIVEQDGRQFNGFQQGSFSENRQSHSEHSGSTFGGFHEATERRVQATAKYRTGLIDYTV
jgi:hypothetical protein